MVVHTSTTMDRDKGEQAGSQRHPQATRAGHAAGACDAVAPEPLNPLVWDGRVGRECMLSMRACTAQKRAGGRRLSSASPRTREATCRRREQLEQHQSPKAAEG